MTDDKDLEEAKRRDEVLKRMLSTKPQPHKKPSREPAKGSSVEKEGGDRMRPGPRSDVK